MEQETVTLTDRELEVFELLAEGKDTQEVADTLFIANKTVRNHIYNAGQKLGLSGRMPILVKLNSLGVITIKEGLE